MKLKTLIVKNFRAYKQEMRIKVGDLTAFIGKNEAGKSGVLDSKLLQSQLIPAASPPRCNGVPSCTQHGHVAALR